jgi:hypothetical protein
MIVCQEDDAESLFGGQHGDLVEQTQECQVIERSLSTCTRPQKQAVARLSLQIQHTLAKLHDLSLHRRTRYEEE